MDKTLFEELVSSLNEAGAIASGRAKASRRFELKDCGGARGWDLCRRLIDSACGYP